MKKITGQIFAGRSISVYDNKTAAWKINSLLGRAGIENAHFTDQNRAQEWLSQTQGKMQPPGVTLAFIDRNRYDDDATVQFRTQLGTLGIVSVALIWSATPEGMLIMHESRGPQPLEDFSRSFFRIK